jgi:3-isopropylmalate/(R)-2-methylmalate dehydratase large subunit
MSDGGALRDDVSTDEITPVAACIYFDRRLGGFPIREGGRHGMVVPDVETIRLLRERRGTDFKLEPWMRRDEGAFYAGVVRVDCATIAPVVAAPGDPGNGIAVAELHPWPAIDIFTAILHRRKAQ